MHCHNSQIVSLSLLTLDTSSRRSPESNFNYFGNLTWISTLMDPDTFWVETSMGKLTLPDNLLEISLLNLYISKIKLKLQKGRQIDDII